MHVIRKPKDFLAGAFFMAVGIAAIVLAQGYAIGTAARMQSGYFPALLGIVLCGLALVLLVRSFLGPREPMPFMAIGRPLIVLAATALFTLLLRPAGLPLAIVAMVVVASLGSAEARQGSTVVLALALAGGSLAVFVYGLGQPLPVLGSWFGTWAR